MTKSRAVPILLAFAMLAWLPACSRLRLLYDYADWVLMIQMHKYIQVADEPDGRLEKAVDDYMVWHRREMLPEYARIAREITRGLREGRTADAIFDTLGPDFEKAKFRTIEPLVAPIVEAMAAMDDKGVARLEKVYAKDYADMAALYSKDPKKGMERRVKRTLDTVKDYAGSLSGEQQEKLRALAMGVKMPTMGWLEDRKRHQDAFLAMLKDKKSPGELLAFYRDWALAPTFRDNDPARMNVDEARRYFREMMAILTQEQIQAAAGRIDELALDFEHLAKEAAPVPLPKPTPVPERGTLTPHSAKP